MNVNYDARETGDRRPTPTGEFDGVTRASALRQLLEKHDAELPKASWFVRLLSVLFVPVRT